VVGLGRGLIDCFFPRMKEDFSNILTLKEGVLKGLGSPLCALFISVNATKPPMLWALAHELVSKPSEQ
jgi:hypothetical protein